MATSEVGGLLIVLLAVVMLGAFLLAPQYLESKRLPNRYLGRSDLRGAILRLAPVGTSIVEASKRLEAEGLECAPSSYAPFEDQAFLTYAHCTGQGSIWIGVGTTAMRRSRRTYRIALVDEGGKLSDALVAIRYE